MSGVLLKEPVSDKTAQAVLDQILALHPDQHLTIPALIREMIAGASGFGDGAELECAVRDLVGEGLLSLHRGQLRPTRHALEAEGMAPRRGVLRSISTALPRTNSGR